MLKRILFFIANWFLILTLPIYGGAFLLFALIEGVMSGDKQARDVVSGREFML